MASITYYVYLILSFKCSVWYDLTQLRCWSLLTIIFVFPTMINIYENYNTQIVFSRRFDEAWVFFFFLTF